MKIIFSTALSRLGGGDPLEGIKSAALGTIAILQRVTPSAIVYGQAQPVSEKEVKFEAKVIPGSYEINTAQVEVLKNGVLIETLPARVVGSTAVATWPARQVVDLKAAYTARAVMNSGTSLPLGSAYKEVPLVRITYVDKRGQETLAPEVSDPEPVITLDPVTATQVSLLGDGTRAQVRISGEVTDGLADIVPDGMADVTKVTVGDQILPVARVSEPRTLARPYAFRGRFSGTVTVDVRDGQNTVEVEAQNAIGTRGYDSFTVNVKHEVSVSMPPPTGNFETPKFVDPFTLAASPMRSDAVDSVVLARGSVSVSGSEPKLTETAPASLVFVGATPELGRTTLQLEAPLVVNQPTLREVVKAELSATIPGLWGETLELVESAPDSALFRSVARRLPSNQTLEILLSRVPDPSSVDTLRVKLGSDPRAEPEPLTETAVDSRVFTGRVSGLGTARIEVYLLQQATGQPATLRVFLDASELSVSSYFVELVETNEGNLRFQTRVVVLPLADEPPPQATVTQATVVSVDDAPGSDGGLFEPVWVVAKGLRSLRSDDFGRLGGDRFELASEPAPGGVSGSATAIPYARFRLPVAFVRDPGMLRVPNVRSALQDPEPADLNQVRPVEHVISYEVVSQDFRVSAQTATVSLSKAGAVPGTKSVLTLVSRWRRDRKPARVLIQDEVAAETKETQVICPPTGNECTFILKAALTVPESAKLGPREISIEFENEEPQKLAQRFHVERRRLIVLAMDGLGWDPFEALKADDTAFGRLFGEGAQKRGQNLRRQALTTFTPITYGRWATIFSGALAKEHRIPSNQFLNRQARIDPGGNHGDLDQCLGCAGKGHMDYVLKTGGSYNRHFQVDFVYDKLQQQKQGRSIVIFQQAGLGRDNESPSKNGEWIQPKIVGVVLRIIYNLALTVRKQSSTVDEVVASEAGKQLRTRDFDVMVLYLAGLDHFLHEGASPDVVESTTSYIREEISPRIDAVLEECNKRFHGTAVFAMFPDHGHMAMEPKQFMDIVKRGDALERAGLPTWLDVLRPNGRYRTSKTPKLSGVLSQVGVDANVVFVPHGGIAHVYVARNAEQGAAQAEWRQPPSLETLEPLVNNIFNAYVKDKGISAPIADILVRVPAPASPDSFEGSQYMVVPADYVPDPTQTTCGESGNEPCTLSAQLVDLSTLESRPFNYADPARRVADWISENTGDIVPLANMRAKYVFDPEPLRSTHGSLGFDDALIPFAFSYPGATGSFDEDTMLAPVLELLSGLEQTGLADDPIKPPTEAKAIGRFFGVE